MSDWGALPEFVRMIAALVFVLALMGGLLLILKRMGLAGAVDGAGRNGKRLAVVESLSLDARRRLVLIQRDDVQHLVILSANRETVLETGIAPRDSNIDVE